MKRTFLLSFPHAFVVIAHLAGTAIALWMQRYDLLIAGIAFGVPSTLLFFDLLPGGKGWIVRMIERIVR